jgi:hypothetical protein
MCSYCPRQSRIAFWQFMGPGGTTMTGELGATRCRMGKMGEGKEPCTPTLVKPGGSHRLNPQRAIQEQFGGHSQGPILFSCSIFQQRGSS